jgi:predicted secreted Zn-dependent protease
VRLCALLAVAVLAACGGGAPPSTHAATRTLDQRLDESLKPIPAGVRVLARVSTYEIGGASVAEARQTMARMGRADNAGRRWAGYTTWRYSWRWEYETLTSCQIKNATVTLTLQVDVPVLSEAAQQDSTMRAWYEGWFNRLFEHEAGHATLARDGAREIYQRIRMLQGASCDDVGNRANQLARQMLDTFNDRQRAYDATTLHGARPAVTTPVTPPR